ncbi:MAG: GNAT family N-acetyltransferase [Lachnospiraceae bacterium]|nr:GNAT family N-acetyltransferase [Lachnospiraceae bacterium]
MTNTRVCLRQFNIDDAGLLRANQMPDATIEEVKEIIESWKSKTYQGKYFEMFALTVNDTVVGSISLYGRADKIASIGAEIFPDERGKGYAAEGLKLVMEKAKGMGYLLAQDQVRADNAASIALHEKLGFETDGYVYKNAKGRDVLIYSKCLIVKNTK